MIGKENKFLLKFKILKYKHERRKKLQWFKCNSKQNCDNKYKLYNL